jgi:hypothetical protein
MLLDVKTKRLRARRVATVPLADFIDPTQAMDRLRSWALTRGISIEDLLSWTLSEREPGEARCPIPRDIEIHPDVGLVARQLSSNYVAYVSVQPASHAELPDPESVRDKLRAWAKYSGYEVLGDAEVFPLPNGDYELRLPITRRALRTQIEV